MEELTNQILAVDSFVWQPYLMPLILLLTGGLITVRTGLVQVRRFPLAVRMVFASAFKKSTAQDGTITPFQALSTALASTVGNGNIGGVATAILIGGPGAIFWMWVCAAVGMATKYAEALLGVHFRVTRETGELAAHVLHHRWNPISFACQATSARLRVLRRRGLFTWHGQHGPVEHRRTDVCGSGANDL